MSNDSDIKQLKKDVKTIKEAIVILKSQHRFKKVQNYLISNNKNGTVNIHFNTNNTQGENNELE